MVSEVAITLRPATLEDETFLLTLANDTTVRTVSFSSQLIQWAEHKTWFRQKLSDPTCYLFIIQDKDTFQEIGHIRLDGTDKKNATISISLIPEVRGKGAGVQAILIATQIFFQKTSFETIHAFIKPDNTASIRAFEKASFEFVELTSIKGLPAWHYQRKNNT